MILTRPEIIKQLRQMYPAGTKVKLVHTDDPYTKLRRGDFGVVTKVDDAGSIHVNWDNGSTLAMLYGVDCVKKVG